MIVIIMSLIQKFEDRNIMMKHYCSLITGSRILEIGIFKGEFMEYIINNCNIGSIDGVDIFEGVTCSGDSDGNNVVHYPLDISYLELSEKYKDNMNVKLIKYDSSSYLKSLPDNYYDIIYIDGDHSYNGVKNDLSESFYKIKNGGYIMGHDYEMNMNKAKNVYNFGVKRAVDEFCSIYSQSIIAKAMDGCVSYCIQITK
jgi:hypothetical protein